MNVARIVVALVASVIMAVGVAGTASADPPGMTHNTIVPDMTHN
ncbi:hypothetical protein [Actinophytocola sp.]|jgi:hypothetical protein